MAVLQGRPGSYLDWRRRGQGSFAAGTQAKATQNGSFVWGDGTNADLTSPAANTFTVRASGGIWLGTTSSPAITAGHFIDTSTGAYLSSAGAWTDNSSAEANYSIERSDDAGSTWAHVFTVGAGIETYSDTSVSEATEYVYRVQATKSGNASFFFVIGSPLESLIWLA